MLHNGALIVENGEVLRCRPLARALARRVIALGREAGADPVVHAGQSGEGRLLVEGWDESNTMLHYYLDKSHPDVSVVEVLRSRSADDPLQVMFGGPLAGIEALWELLQRAGGRRGADRAHLLSAPGRGLPGRAGARRQQGRGARVPAGALGVPAAQTLAVGDNWNDHEMLERAGLGW